jgi:hypothetical protein
VAAVADLITIVPSRGRPHAVARLAWAFATCTADTVLMLVVDDDDPTLPDYRAAVEAAQAAGRKVGIGTGAAQNMNQALNGAARLLVDEATKKPPFAIGFMGDDHRPRTDGWDAAYLSALRELGTGLVYGNDLIQGEGLPTQVAMTADIVRAWGWFAPPALSHLYLDNFWLDLGRAAGCIRYLPDVVVEHCHPVVGKSPVDDGYLRVNAPAVYERDRLAYEAFHRDGGFVRAVDAVRTLRGGA